MPARDCVLAFLSDVSAHRNRPHLTALLCVPNQRNTTPLSSVTLWSWIKATLSRASFYLFLSRGHMCSNACLTSSDWPSSWKTRARSTHQLTRRTCSETDGVRERVGTVWDELHICRSQGIGPQPVRDYTVERRSQWESEFNFNLSDPEVKESWATGQKSQRDGSGGRVLASNKAGKVWRAWTVRYITFICRLSL